MATPYGDDRRRASRGTGSLRERSPGVWEIRIVVGFDPVRGRSVQRSFTVRGDREHAEARRRELVADVGIIRVDVTALGGRMTVGELLERFLAGSLAWQPATLASHRHVVGTLLADRLAQRRLAALSPGYLRATIRRWQQERLSVPTVSGRWLVLRSAVSWAVDEEFLPTNPLAGMRGPPRPTPRRRGGDQRTRRRYPRDFRRRSQVQRSLRLDNRMRDLSHSRIGDRAYRVRAHVGDSRERQTGPVTDAESCAEKTCG